MQVTVCSSGVWLQKDKDNDVHFFVCGDNAHIGINDKAVFDGKAKGCPIAISFEKNKDCTLQVVDGEEIAFYKVSPTEIEARLRKFLEDLKEDFAKPENKA